jgi:nitrosocyanin
MKNYLILLIVLGLLGGGYMLMKKSGSSTNEIPSSQPAATVTTGTSSSDLGSATGSSGVMTTSEQSAIKEFTVEGGMYYFTPKEIRVKKGDTVKVTLTNKEGLHDFVLDEFNAKTKKIKAGETDTVTFTASKVGTFEYYCSVGNHRAMGMKGNLIVE